MNLQFTVFKVKGGYAALCWDIEKERFTHSLLPVKRASTAKQRMRENGAEEAKVLPAWVQLVMRRMQRYFQGDKDSFADVTVDVANRPDFHRKIYSSLRKVAYGETVSYGQMAERVGSPNAARAVGQAMAKNPLPLIIPCHRVVSSVGKLHGFSAERGTDLKAEMLALESY